MFVKLFVKDSRLRPILRTIVFAIAVLFLGSVLWVVVDAALRRPFTPTLQFADLATGEIAVAVAVAICAIVMRRYVDRRSVASLGFAPRGPWLRFLAIGVLFGAGMQGIALGFEVASGAARVTGHGALVADVRIVAIAVLVFLAAAFSEEMSMRGYVLQNLWEEWGVGPAVGLSSIAFAALHLGNPHSREQAGLTAAGLCLFALWACMSLVWSGSLWLALGAHMAWNVCEGPVFGLPVSGVDMPMPTVLDVSVNGPQWLTGGAFGPEAGLSAIIALLAGFGVLRLLHARGAFAGAADTCEAYAFVKSPS